ncbi:MAG: ATP-binding cassette domain-containing protein [Bacillota bacterium]
MIHIQNLSRTFGPLRAVDDITLHVARGEIFGLVGPDGAGKTTLIRLICGILTPDRGSVTMQAAGHFGYMPQRFSLYGELTVWENIIFFGTLYGLKRQLIQQRGEEILTITGLWPFQDRLADNLSGGMKQKLALTCALLSHPRLLVLDEPTFGVDPQSRRDFWRILYHLNKEGITILVSTPYMDEAELCHRVGFLNAGRLVAVDTPPNLQRSFPTPVFSLQGKGISRQVLSGIPGVQPAGQFGHRYRLFVQSETGRRELAAHLKRQGIAEFELEEVSPTMEDVFTLLAESPPACGTPGEEE